MIAIWDFFVSHLDFFVNIIRGVLIILGLGLLIFAVISVGLFIWGVTVVANPPLPKKDRVSRAWIEQLDQYLITLGQLEFSHGIAENSVRITLLKHRDNEYELKARLGYDHKIGACFSNEFDSLEQLVKFIQQYYIADFRDLLAQQFQMDKIAS
jgi:hypothetical protein